MLKLIAEIIISAYLTSTLFMLYFFINAEIVTYKREGHFFKMPLKLFLMAHFCPIIHTIKVFTIFQKFNMIKEKRGL